MRAVIKPIEANNQHFLQALIASRYCMPTFFRLQIYFFSSVFPYYPIIHPDSALLPQLVINIGNYALSCPIKGQKSDTFNKFG